MQDREAMDIFGNLRLCFTLLHRSGERRRHCHGGFRGRGRVLAFLREHPGVSQREVAESLGIRPPSASELLERLAAEELVERRVNETDRRSLQVFLTEKGAKLADHVGRNRQREAAEWLEGFSEAERVQFAHLLEKLAVSLKKRTAFAGVEEGEEPDHGDACGCGGHGGADHGGCCAHAAGEEREQDRPEGHRHRHGCGCGGMRGKRRGGKAI